MSNSSFRVKNNLIIGHKATNPILQFEGGSDNGYIDYTVSRMIIDPGGGQLDFKAGNARRMYITTSGNFVLGGDSTVSNGLRAFDLNNLASTTGSSTGSVIRLITSNTAGTGTTSFEIVKYKEGSVKFINYEPDSSAYISFIVVDEKLRICSNGNIGIGTTGPARKLDIVQTSTDYQFRMGDGTNYYDIGRNTTTGLLTFYGSQSAASGYKFSTVNGDRMIIGTNGNIGINTSPSADTTYRWLTIIGPTTSGGGMFHLYNSDSSVGINMFCNNLAGYIGTSSSSPLLFRINNGEVSRFDTSGNLLIGTASNIGGNVVQLQLAGYNATGGTGFHNFLSVKNTYGSATNPNKYFRLGSTGSLEIINSDYNAILFTLDNAGNVTALANITAYSDVNLKTDITTIDNALDKVSKMRGVMFTRKDTGVRGTGVIAQEMQEVLPEVVQEGENLSVAYGNIVGVLIEAIKELKAEIELLKGK